MREKLGSCCAMGRKPKRNKAVQENCLKKQIEESMSDTIKSVADGLFGENQAVGEFCVPTTTLKDRLAGRVALKARSRLIPYLKSEEESELVQFLVKCAEIDFPNKKMN